MRFPRMLDGGNPTELRAKAQHARKLADRADELVDRLREEAPASMPRCSSTVSVTL